MTHVSEDGYGRKMRSPTSTSASAVGRPIARPSRPDPVAMRAALTQAISSRPRVKPSRAAAGDAGHAAGEQPEGQKPEETDDRAGQKGFPWIGSLSGEHGTMSQRPVDQGGGPGREPDRQDHPTDTPPERATAALDLGRHGHGLHMGLNGAESGYRPRHPQPERGCGHDIQPVSIRSVCK